MALEKPSSSKYLNYFRICVILAVSFLIMSIASRIGSYLLTNHTYQTYIGISASTSMEERIETYTSAIYLSPEEPTAYQLLLSAYGEDGIFGKQESEQFLAIYNANHNGLQKSGADFANLQSQIGFLYVNGYEDPSTITRLRMALPFLLAANSTMEADNPQRNTVNCYCQIGTFYEDYIWNASSVREITAPVMENLISEIEKTLDAFQEDDSPDAIFNMLGFKVAACDLLYDQRDIIAYTIPHDRIDAVLDQIYSGLPESGSLQKEQTKNLLQTLTSNEQNYREMLDRAYSRKEGA